MIRSNVKEVLERIASAKKRIPQKITSALTPNNYVPALKWLAEQVLQRSTNDVEKAAIPLMVRTMIAEHLSRGGMSFEMHSVPMETLGQGTNTTGDPDWTLIPREEVVAWVAEYKEKTERDRYKTTGDAMTDEVIAARVVHAIMAEPYPWIRTDWKGHGALNPTGLAAIVGLTNLPAARVSSLLLEVLLVWTAYMRQRVPLEVKRAIRESF